MELNLQNAIGVFDAGIGSYSAAALVRRHYPLQDIVYFADRASFPYGAKSKAELSAVVLRAIDQLTRLGTSAIVLASNAPSVVVLEDILPQCKVPVLGIYPPVAEAIAASKSRHVAVLGVQSLVSSAEMQSYLTREGREGKVEVVNASPLVALVENGWFLSRREETQQEVDQFMQALGRQHPQVDTCTLSSTHLPWLLEYFQRAAPGMTFLDPAEKLVPALAPYTSAGSGTTVCVATESPVNPLSGLREMFKVLGIELEPHLLKGAELEKA